MASGISKGDKVRIFVNGDSWMTSVEGIERVWTVMYTPASDVDTWIFERNGQVIEVNPGSANFDGLELVERKEATNGS